ncbi:MAG: rhodanese-like domain-containing protein [Candidatus Moraniibacteriota bacterium]
MNEKEKKENKIIFFGIGLILLILLITISRYSFDNKNAPTAKKQNKENIYTDYSYITALELNKKIINKEDVVLLDIRDSVSFENSHIENSINISPQNFEKTIESLNKDHTIAIIGYDYEKKTDVAAIIKKMKDELEFKNVLALSGGIIGWAEEGNQIISGGNKESALDWSKIDYIIPEQLKLAIDNQYPVFILDTRLNSQYKSGHIPGAVNIPLEEIEKRKSELPISKEILVYGASTDDDFKASVKLNDLGFLATYTLQGGFNSWQEKRFDLAR